MKALPLERERERETVFVIVESLQLNTVLEIGCLLLWLAHPAGPRQAKPVEPSLPCLQSETGPRGPEPFQIGLKVKNMKRKSMNNCGVGTKGAANTVFSFS